MDDAAIAEALARLETALDTLTLALVATTVVLLVGLL